ncbi:MAG TPA: ferritin-like domain-containing protein [Tepidiformaceae bacterium]|nr:ferritin-like domain-containing protein [Tepidiformaceae bacterium]
MKELTTLHDLFLDEIKDLYSAEKQLLKALPKLIKRASSGELSRGLQKHLEQTEEQVTRLEQVFAELSVPARAKKCVGMEGIIEEGDEILEHEGDPDVIDAGIIAAAQKVEHYEIAAYGTAVAHAKAMGHTTVERLLQETLDEEYEADKKLTAVAEGFVNRLATVGADEAEERPTRSRSRSESRRDEMRASPDR